MPASGYIILCPRAADVRILMQDGAPVTISDWKTYDRFVRKFAHELYAENIANGFVDTMKNEMSCFTACAIFRQKPSEVRWLSFRVVGLPGIDHLNCDKHDVTQLEAFFDGRWRLATPDERRKALEQQRADTIAAAGNVRDRKQNDFKKAIADLFKKV